MASIYNSRNEAYKTPFGAVHTGQRVRFTLRVPALYGCQTPFLFLRQDGQEPKKVPMQGPVRQQEVDVFTLWYAPEAEGLYFYWFDLWVDFKKIYRGLNGEGFETAGEGTPYQLTVYRPEFETPKGVRGGVMYQIFPDRFFEGDPEKAMVYNERIYRKDKSKEPYFWPTEQEAGYLTQDYFGGDLAGIQRRLPFLHSLGVTWIYINPIFEAHSNHRYNTADYLNVDPYLGTNEDFVSLCAAAAGVGIRILLDGVFNHTGSDSIYFNKEGRYASLGAWQGPQSPYRGWYKFRPDGSCESWWGFETLPTCNPDSRGFRDFVCAEGGVIDTWLQRGAAGFRLDVVDELPDDFVAEIRKAVKRGGNEKLLLGEVWEDASNKEAYHVRRKYFLGQELDGVMNYPFRTAILDFLQDFNAAEFENRVMTIVENYPAPALAACTTHLSTHDTVRAITELVGIKVGEHGRDWQSGRILSPEVYELGMQRMRLAFVLQFMLPGVPCVYYGDEIGMQGYKDPFNRAYYNWNSGETRLISLMIRLAQLRKDCPAFQDGTCRFLRAENGIVVFEREGGGAMAAIALNCSDWPVTLPLLGEDVPVPAMGYAIRTASVE